MACFEGSCYTPLAAYAKINRLGKIDFKCSIAKPDGSKLLSESFTCHKEDAIANAQKCAKNLKEIGGDNFFD